MFPRRLQMQTAPHLLPQYLSCGTSTTAAMTGAETDLKQQGCKAILFITGEWSAFSHSRVSFLFAGCVHTTTPPITSRSVVSPQIQTSVMLLQQGHITQEIILLTCISCALQENSFYCAAGTSLHVSFLSPLLQQLMSVFHSLTHRPDTQKCVVLNKKPRRE